MSTLPMMAALLLSASPRQPSGAELERSIERLGVVGNVLYVAAHPDDEDTTLLSYLRNERLLRAGYLALTRGEGGQNLIGSEQGAQLGLIRTQELLAARRVDGAEQFFTRARDFGYSKTPEETLEIWGKDDVLADVVWVVRSFKPDVIITRFSPEREETHGHHTASAMLAVEAFKLAADPTFHPEQLKFVSTWQAKRIVWDAWSPSAKPGDAVPGALKLDIGGYNPRLGISYGEMAAQSRSMHKSQGFGASARRGPLPVYFRTLAGEPPTSTLFDGVDLTWGRVPGSARFAQAAQRAKDQFNEGAPWASVPALLEARAALEAMPDFAWKEQKRIELVDAIAACAGLWAEVTAPEASTVPGAELKVTVNALNRSSAPLQLKEVRFSDGTTLEVGKPLAENAPLQLERAVHVPADAALSNPYWLTEAPKKGTFTVPDPKMIGLPEEPSALRAELVFGEGNQTFSLVRPVLYKWTDPVAGERSRRVELLPPVLINPAASVLMFPDAQARELRVVLKAVSAGVSGTLRPRLPERWSAQPESIPFTLTKPGDEKEVAFQLHPPAQSGSGVARLIAEVGEQRLDHGLVRVEHEHIPLQTLLPLSDVKLVRFEMKRGKSKLGYIVGAGDEVPGSLRQVGYDVTLLDDAALRNEPLGRFDAIVVGVRAYNTNPKMPAYYQRLMDYVTAGGTLVAQYNTVNWVSQVPAEIGPYPFQISRDRVTDETAPVTFESATAPVLLKPNKLGPPDFEDWVQERGLYFADKWDARYQTVLAMNDPGEPVRKGSVLVARHGKGTFIYTGLAFFRQLPAGVPGAYRLFANLLAYGR